MKKLILALLCVLLSAGLVFAADIDFKGMYYARGSYLENDTGVGNENVTGSGADDAAYMFFYGVGLVPEDTDDLIYARCLYGAQYAVDHGPAGYRVQRLRRLRLHAGT